MKRKNLGNYEHEEISVEAVLAEGEDASEAVLELRKFVESSLDLKPITSGLVTEKVTLKPLGNEPAATANFVKEAPVKEKNSAPRTRKAAEKPAEAPQEAAPSENTGGAQTVAEPDTGKVQPPVESKTPVASTSIAKGTVLYDATVKEHRSRFATYLGTTFPKWKTAKPEPEIKAFSLGLHGKPFENAKGEMLDSFKAELAGFFGV